ncbi:MAG: hypothetical protein ABIX37_00840 [Gammaproteobacteria bacterium]
MRRGHRYFGRRWLVAVLALLAVATDGEVSAKDDSACLRLENRIADLRLKLRLGYSAREGRVYRQKLAALEAERRMRCR